MFAILYALVFFIADIFKLRRRLEGENRFGAAGNHSFFSQEKPLRSRGIASFPVRFTIAP
jgi:hypothetical protein